MCPGGVYVKAVFVSGWSLCLGVVYLLTVFVSCIVRIVSVCLCTCLGRVCLSPHMSVLCPDGSLSLDVSGRCLFPDGSLSPAMSGQCLSPGSVCFQTVFISEHVWAVFVSRRYLSS